jgi:predicted secreted protein
MSLPLSGSDCILSISDGQATPAFRQVEGLRVTGWKLVHNEVDVTTSSSDGWRRLLSGAGLRSLDLRIAGLYLGSTGEMLLRAAALSGSTFVARLTLDPATALRGEFLAIELELDGNVNEEATYAALLRSAGPITIG